ncbi:hypothetical protein NEOLEDRAFT_167754 [Neolentinus lepideus HHB14362 ss-1]|uniref:Flavin reductase like domain-containing protein n=1 Tax=Neolentinus lepideus HHB14362 ss-1 TaxID=1314782 RepID=A0A165TW75_9AGAM|nr:hypothetical protein NEOLEDRAFT_167754 [Neolentinus lepideus HHB14362 ss-1]
MRPVVRLPGLTEKTSLAIPQYSCITRYTASFFSASPTNVYPMAPKRKRADMTEATFASPAMLDDYPSVKAYRLLEPGPVVLVSTLDTSQDEPKPNLMTIGFHMVIQHEDPPLFGVVIGPWDHSYAALKKTKECVIAVPTVDLMEKVVDIGNCSGEDVDKFEKFGLTPLKANRVGAPLVRECMANFECKVEDTKLVGKYNVWLLKVVRGWIDSEKRNQKTFHHKGDGTFVLDGETIDLQERMTKWKEYQD